MKKVFPFLVLPILFLIQSCSFNNSEIETDFFKTSLKGDVVLVSSIEPTNGSSFVQVYNDNGMLTKDFWGKTGGNYYHTEITYDNDKKLSTKRYGYWGTGFFQNDEKYSYDQNGRLESINSNDFVTTYEYDEEGRLSIETVKDKLDYSYKSKKEYFYSGNKLDSTIYDCNNGNGGRDVSYFIDKFNGNNHTSEIYSVSSDGNRFLSSLQNFKKNESGDLIEKVINGYDIKGNVTNTETTKYEYDYDKKKNWVQMRSIENGELKNNESRTIVYKGGDTSIYISVMEKILSSFNGGKNSNNSIQNNEETESSGLNSSSNSQSVKIKCSSCKGSGKCRECGKTFKKQYYKGNGSYEYRNETRPGLVMCGDCWGRGHKKVKRTEGGWEPGEDCYVSSCEDGWRVCSECNNSGNGRNIGQCRSCKGTGF
jgi:hypothetical protein